MRLASSNSSVEVNLALRIPDDLRVELVELEECVECRWGSEKTRGSRQKLKIVRREERKCESPIESSSTGAKGEEDGQACF